MEVLNKWSNPQRLTQQESTILLIFKKKKIMNFNEVIVARPTNSEMNEWMLTIGNEMASEERFATKEEAEARVQQTDWNLVAVIAVKIAEMVVEKMLKKATSEVEQLNSEEV